MKIETYRKAQGMVAAFVGAGVAVTALNNQVLASLAVVLAGMAAMLLLRRQIKEVMNDEMVYRMSERASRRAFQVFTFAAAVFGVFALALRNSIPSDFYLAGQVLAYSACALLVLYTAFYAYYGRKGVK
jgi:uncharacterized membrane protein